MNIEKMFMDDVRQKKRIAVGVYHRASRKGFIRGGVKTQSDYMSKKEKNKLNGEVKVYNMYDKYNEIENVPQIVEIEKMSMTDRINLYRFLKGKYSNVILQKHWKVSSGTLYNKIYEKYNLYTPRNKDKKKSKADGIYNVIEEVPQLEVVLQMAKSQRKGMLMAVKQQFSAKAITEHWGISRTKLYSIYNNNELFESKEIKAENANKVEVEEVMKNKDVEVIEPTNVIEPNKENQNEKLLLELIGAVNSLKTTIETSSEEIPSISNGFKIEMNGEYSKKEVENKLLSIANILEEQKKYKITFTIEEI